MTCRSVLCLLDTRRNFALLLTNKHTTGCIRVSEKTPSRQLVNSSNLSLSFSRREVFVRLESERYGGFRRRLFVERRWLSTMRTSKDVPNEESRRETGIRYMNDLLQKLRVILPGVQVTFAFLLTVAFMDRFAQATELQRSVYFTALLSTAMATAFFIAPTIQHRILWRQGGASHEAEDGQQPSDSGNDTTCPRDKLRGLPGCRRRVRKDRNHRCHGRNGVGIRGVVVPVAPLSANKERTVLKLAIQR